MSTIATRPTDAPAADGTPAPVAIEPGIELPPDGLGYRLKSRLLGPPLHTDQLEHERLGKPTALAVFASDNLSSSAYATEEILRVLVPAVGVAAFSLVVPITVAMLVVLGVPDPVVPPDDQGVPDRRRRLHRHPRQLRAPARPGRRRGPAHRLHPHRRRLGGRRHRRAGLRRSARCAVQRARSSVGVHRLIAFGNLRGVKESGRLFAVPTYFFIVNMVAAARRRPLPAVLRRPARSAAHARRVCSTSAAGGDGLLIGASLFVVLHAFASGGAAVTGVEAISNGVPAFQEPAWQQRPHDARDHGHPARASCSSACRSSAPTCTSRPFEEGTPTVISQIGELVYGDSAARPGALLLAAGRHDADPGPGRQHQLRRLPPAGQLPRRRQLHAPPAHQARPPARVLQRHHLPGRRRPIVLVDRHRRQGRPADPALRHRRVHQLHPVAGGHGQAPHPPEGAGLAERPGHQRHRRGPVRSSSTSSSPSPSSPTAPG